MLIGHTLVIPSLFIAPFTGLVIIFIFSTIEKPKWVKNGFTFLGYHSTNIWLIHMFFYRYIFVNFVFIGKYPLVILGIMLVITLICSILLNKIMLNIKSVL